MDAVEEIKSRLPVEEVVSRYVDLKRSGASYKGLCPFHQEKTPSFYVNPQRGNYKCFGCAKGGDIFSFVMEMEHLEFPDALKRLAEQAGVSLPERQAQKPSLKGKLFEANEAAMRFFQGALASAEGRRAAEYLFERGFGQDAIDLFDLGYAPPGRESLVRALSAESFDERVLLAAGLAIQDDVGGKLRDRFRARLMFPIKDASGRVSGFGGRILADGQPKYLNSPQTEIFDKSSVLFGIQRSQDAIRQAGRAVLVEGYLDAVRAHVAGFLYTVASLGTAVTPPQLTALARLSGTVIIALDPDPAGQTAAARTALTALLEVTKARSRAGGMTGVPDLRIAQLPEGYGDPDDLIRDHPDRWERALDDSLPAFEFFFQQTMDSLDRSSDAWRQEAVDRLLPVIQQLSGSPGWQATWLERLAADTGIDPRALQRAMPAQRRKRREQPGSDVVAKTTSRALTGDPVEELERGLLALLVQLLVIPREAAEALDGAELAHPEHRVILDRLLSWQNYDYDLFREGLPDEIREVADALRAREVPLPPDGKVSVAVKLHLARLRQARVQSEYQRALQLLQTMPLEDQLTVTAGMADLDRQKQAIEAEIAHLHDMVPRAQQAG